MLKSEISIDLHILTDGDKFRQILLNLFSNALEYSIVDSMISVGVIQHATSLTLTVGNQPEALTPDDLPYLTQRF